MRISTTKHTGKQIIGRLAVITAVALCAMLFACRTALAGNTSTTPPGVLVDLTTDSAGRPYAWSKPYSGYHGQKAFDNGANETATSHDSSRWLAAKSQSNMFVTYRFKFPTAVDAIGIFIPGNGGGAYNERAPRDWTFQGSDDGSTWTTLDTRSGEDGWAANDFRYYKFENTHEYQYYKFNCTTNNGNSACLQIRELEFYNSTGESPTAYFEDLTTSSAGSMKAYSTQYSEGYGAAKAFDNGSNINYLPSTTDAVSGWSIDTTRWLSGTSSTPDSTGYITYQFNNATVVNGLGVEVSGTGRAPKNWTLLGSTDNSSWTTLDTRTNETDWNGFAIRHYSFANTTAYKYYKFNCTANNGDSRLQIHELEFYNSSAGPTVAAWTGCGETASISDAGNWYPALPGTGTTRATIGFTGDGYAAVPDGTVQFDLLFVGDWLSLYRGSRPEATIVQTNGTLTIKDLRLGHSANCTGRFEISGGTFNNTSEIYLGQATGAVGELVQTGGAIACTAGLFVGFESGGSGIFEMSGGTCSAKYLVVGRNGTGTAVISGPTTVLTTTPTDNIDVRVGSSSTSSGTLVVTNGAKIVTRRIWRGSGGVPASQAHVTFDGGILQATHDYDGFLKDLADINLKSGGLAIESEGHNLGITNCTFNVTPGAKISVTGGGTVTFTGTTVNLTESPSRGFTLAETDGVFSGLPAFSGPRGWKIKMSADARRIRISPIGFMMLVK